MKIYKEHGKIVIDVEQVKIKTNDTVGFNAVTGSMAGITIDKNLKDTIKVKNFCIESIYGGKND